METQFNENELAACVRRELEQYFKDLDGELPAGIYEMVLNCVERPLLEVILDRAGSNQSRAAEWLGINRNTLRKKMQQHGIK
ncbi:MAG TPA: Fis family transcriptional regulator [Thiobacillaceae bacterium]|nr:Fis family transcriptional regulator [Thiobacillaceae bacterium]HNA81242.1 Fis family transcriptional regulator [Thiobacillaceae bacterium]HNF89193.1 Fis family transcriptional regulator [Thiobacillaceae bacterium]HNH87942.1 Fis family transcriptional regulator [Thiobacillaceae bacterium]HNI08487.1 Fis family transcriptional regulator [Thiobacillaceae bacterium]